MNVSTLESSTELAVYDGVHITVPCPASLGGTVRWSYTRTLGEPPNVIFDGNAIDSKYMNKVTVNIDHSSQDYNLTLHAVQLNNYGWYICYIDNNNGSTFVHPFLITVKG